MPLILNRPKWFQNMPDYVWICLNRPEYTGICVNMPKSAWTAFVLHFLFFFFAISFLLELVIIVWIRNMRLFSWRDKIWYFYCSRKYFIFLFSFFFFLLRLYIFTCNITFRVRGMMWWVGDRHSWYTFLVFGSFLVKTCKEIK